MKLSETDLQILEKLEESLWRSETRFDLAFQEKVFASDFFEFGRSGRIYTRQQIIRTDGGTIKASLPLKNFQVRPLDANNVLVTYISEVQNEVLERANRCSVWSRVGGSWELRFHQGTPTA